MQKNNLQEFKDRFMENLKIELDQYEPKIMLETKEEEVKE